MSESNGSGIFTIKAPTWEFDFGDTPEGGKRVLRFCPDDMADLFANVRMAIKDKLKDDDPTDEWWRAFRSFVYDVIKEPPYFMANVTPGEVGQFIKLVELETAKKNAQRSEEWAQLRTSSTTTE